MQSLPVGMFWLGASPLGLKRVMPWLFTPPLTLPKLVSRLPLLNPTATMAQLQGRLVELILLPPTTITSEPMTASAAGIDSAPPPAPVNEIAVPHGDGERLKL